MAIRKLPNGKYQLDIHPELGTNKRIRRNFRTKAEAQKAQREMMTAYEKTGDFGVQKKDNRRLSELVNQWYELHGLTLRDGEHRQSKLLKYCDKLGNPLARNFTATDFAEFRKKRIESGISFNTANHDLSDLKSLYNKLIELEAWEYENPLAKVKPIKIDEFVPTYLNLEQISLLLSCYQDDVYLVVKVCLSTGCRWSEAQNLLKTQVRDNKISFEKTKNSHARIVPISSELFDEIQAFGRNRKSKLFDHAIDRFKYYFPEEIELPRGQLTHVLRHSFAVHFMLDGGNILDLQKILGHKTLAMTLRYAQYHPDYLKDAVTRNPIARMSASKELPDG